MSFLHTFLLLFLSSFGLCRKIPIKLEPALMIVSYDGFKPEYLDWNKTPNLNKFAEAGVSTEFLKAVFPTKTFPNHFTIATVSVYSIFCF